MEKLPERVTENGIEYVLVGDYSIPDLILSEKLWTYLADLNEHPPVPELHEICAL